MKHTLNVLVQNQAGVLSKVSGLFGRRGYNIDSLTVGTTEREDISQMTIVVDGDDHIIEQVEKQLHKVIEVLKIKDLTEEEFVARELMLLKVKAKPEHRTEIMQLAQVFRAHIVDYGRESFILEATGSSSKLQSLQDALEPFGILEMTKTGVLGMGRGL